MIDLLLSLGLPQDQLVVGVPAHGTLYRLANTSMTVPGSPVASPWNYEESIISHSKICAVRDNLNWTLFREKDLTAPYIYYKDKWIGFDDEISIKLKAKYIALRQIGGIALWSANDDDPTGKCGYGSYPLLQSIRSIFTKPVDNINFVKANNSIESSQSGNKFDNEFVAVIEKYGNVERVLNEGTEADLLPCSSYGYLKHPQDCSKFYRCVKFDQNYNDVERFQYSCPIGMVFDERYEICNWPSWSPTCTGSGEIVHVTKKRFICPSYGYFQDADNCEFFYYCSDFGKGYLQAYEFKCPFELAFDEEKLLCNWKWLVKGCDAVNPEDQIIKDLPQLLNQNSGTAQLETSDDQFSERSDFIDVNQNEPSNGNYRSRLRKITQYMTKWVGELGNRLKNLWQANAESRSDPNHSWLTQFNQFMPNFKRKPQNLDLKSNVNNNRNLGNHRIPFPLSDQLLSIPIIEMKPDSHYLSQNKNKRPVLTQSKSQLTTNKPIRKQSNRVQFSKNESPQKDLAQSSSITRTVQKLQDIIPLPAINMKNKNPNEERIQNPFGLQMDYHKLTNHLFKGSTAVPQKSSRRPFITTSRNVLNKLNIFHKEKTGVKNNFYFPTVQPLMIETLEDIEIPHYLPQQISLQQIPGPIKSNVRDQQQRYLGGIDTHKEILHFSQEELKLDQIKKENKPTVQPLEYSKTNNKPIEKTIGQQKGQKNHSPQRPIEHSFVYNVDTGLLDVNPVDLVHFAMSSSETKLDPRLHQKHISQPDKGKHHMNVKQNSNSRPTHLQHSSINSKTKVENLHKHNKPPEIQVKEWMKSYEQNPQQNPQLFQNPVHDHKEYSDRQKNIHHKHDNRKKQIQPPVQQNLHPVQPNHQRNRQQSENQQNRNGQKQTEWSSQQSHSHNSNKHNSQQNTQRDRDIQQGKQAVHQTQHISKQEIHNHISQTQNTEKPQSVNHWPNIRSTVKPNSVKNHNNKYQNSNERNREQNQFIQSQTLSDKEFYANYNYQINDQKQSNRHESNNQKVTDSSKTSHQKNSDHLVVSATNQEQYASYEPNQIFANKKVSTSQINPIKNQIGSGDDSFYGHDNYDSSKSQLLIIPVADEYSDQQKFNFEKIAKEYPKLFPEDLSNTKISTVSYQINTKKEYQSSQKTTARPKVIFTSNAENPSDINDEYIMLMVNNDQHLMNKNRNNSASLHELFKKTDGKLYNLETDNSKTLVALVPKSHYPVTQKPKPLIYETVRDHKVSFNVTQPPVIIKLEIPRPKSDMFHSIVQRVKDDWFTSAPLSYDMLPQQEYNHKTNPVISDYPSYSLPKYEYQQYSDPPIQHFTQPTTPVSTTLRTKSTTEAALPVYDSIQQMINQNQWSQRYTERQESYEPSVTTPVSITTTQTTTTTAAPKDKVILEHIPIYNGYNNYNNNYSFPNWNYGMPWYQQMPSYPPANPYYPSPPVQNQTYGSHFPYYPIPSNYGYQPPVNQQPINSYQPQFLPPNISSDNWYDQYPSSTEEPDYSHSSSSYEPSSSTETTTDTTPYSTILPTTLSTTMSSTISTTVSTTTLRSKIKTDRRPSLTRRTTTRRPKTSTTTQSEDEITTIQTHRGITRKSYANDLQRNKNNENIEKPNIEVYIVDGKNGPQLIEPNPVSHSSVDLDQTDVKVVYIDGSKDEEHSPYLSVDQKEVTSEKSVPIYNEKASNSQSDKNGHNDQHHHDHHDHHDQIQYYNNQQSNNPFDRYEYQTITEANDRDYLQNAKIPVKNDYQYQLVTEAQPHKDVEYEDEPQINPNNVSGNRPQYHQYFPASKAQSLQSLYNSNAYPGLRNFTDGSVPESACTRPGLFQHPYDCNKYYECYWDKYINKFTLHSFECPVKLAFDSRIVGCGVPHDPTICVQY